MSQVLIVEDDPTVLAVIADFLDAYGHEALGCESADEALAAIHNGYVPEMICLDGNLPEMHELDFWHQLRTHPRLAQREMPTVILTNDESTENIEAVHAVGAECLAKPFSSLTFHRAVAMATARARAVTAATAATAATAGTAATMSAMRKATKANTADAATEVPEFLCFS